MSAPLQSSTNANAPAGAGPMQKGFLGKKMGNAPFCSPTDNFLSPCSKKLVQSKQRHYAKGKPLTLSASLTLANAKGPGPSSLAKSSTVPQDSENEQPIQS
ncbi:hypothetical protein RQP46_006373 [Phenoliferia psychrophenolica]